MLRLRRYLFANILSSILLVLLVILGLTTISVLLGERGDLEGNYTFWVSVKYVLLSVPGSLYEMLPFAVLIGCLAGLGSLANNSELVVIRTAGISTVRITWMVMRPALLVMFAGVLISEYIAPNTQSIAQSEKAVALQREGSVSKEGLWHREGQQFMHFKVVQPNGILYGVTIYSFDESGKLEKSTFAERAIFQSDHWLIEDILENTFEEDRIVQRTSFAERWETELSPELLNILVLAPIDLSISGLWEYSRYLESQGLNNGPYLLAFWKKVLQPLSTIMLVLVAVSFVFGPLRQVTMGFRIFIGVIVGIVFRTAQDMLGPASLVYGFSPIYASLIPILVCGFLGAILLQRVK
jgi:lipopolysaccharide export system permease protein